MSDPGGARGLIESIIDSWGKQTDGSKAKQANPRTRPLPKACPARRPLRRSDLAAAARRGTVPLEVVQEVGDRPPPVALGDPHCAGAASCSPSARIRLGEADAMPARWTGRAEGLQVARDRPNRQGDGGPAQ